MGRKLAGILRWCLGQVANWWPMIGSSLASAAVTVVAFFEGRCWHELMLIALVVVVGLLEIYRLLIWFRDRVDLARGPRLEIVPPHLPGLDAVFYVRNQGRTDHVQIHVALGKPLARMKHPAAGRWEPSGKHEIEIPNGGFAKFKLAELVDPKQSFSDDLFSPSFRSQPDWWKNASVLRLCTSESDLNAYALPFGLHGGKGMPLQVHVRLLPRSGVRFQKVESVVMSIASDGLLIAQLSDYPETASEAQ